MARNASYDTVFKSLVAGDTVDFTVRLPDYLASDGWTLSHRFIPFTSGDAITFDGTASGDDFQVTVASSVTEDWTPGDYSWSAYVTKDGARYTIDSGVLKIAADPGTVTTLDSRSFAAKQLAAVESAIAAFQRGVKSYTIGNRQLTRDDMSTLYVERSKLMWEVSNLEVADRIAQGLPNPRHIGIRFNRV
jgi:hypothetical protein